MGRSIIGLIATIAFSVFTVLYVQDSIHSRAANNAYLDYRSALVVYKEQLTRVDIATHWMLGDLAERLLQDEATVCLKISTELVEELARAQYYLSKLEHAALYALAAEYRRSLPETQRVSEYLDTVVDVRVWLPIIEGATLEINTAWAQDLEFCFATDVPFLPGVEL